MEMFTQENGNGHLALTVREKQTFKIHLYGNMNDIKSFIIFVILYYIWGFSLKKKYLFENQLQIQEIH